MISQRTPVEVGMPTKKLERVIFALSGSFRVIVDDGKQKQEYWLKDPHEGLYINQLVWTDLDAFSPNAVCAVLASHRYDEEDYYRDYNEFLDAVL